MIKKLVFTLLLINFTNLLSYGECVTGYACSIKDIDKENKSKKEEKVKNDNKNTEKEKPNQKKKGFFVDGGKYNKPEYTEFFTFRGYF